MQVIAWTMHPKEGDPIVSRNELYRSSDVVSVHLRLSAERPDSSAREFWLMKRSAILVNTARGAIVEPLPPGHPVLALSNVVITPHCAGITPGALGAGPRMAGGNALLGS